MVNIRLFAIVFCVFLGCTKTATKSPVVDKSKTPFATIEGNVALDFSPDGKWLAVGAELIDTSTWKVTALLEERVSDKNPKSKNHWGYTAAAFSPDSKKLAIGDQDGTLRILDVPSMKMTHEVLAHGARLTGIGFAMDNETIVTTSIDDIIRIRIWNYKTGKELLRSDSIDKTPREQGGLVVDIVNGVDVFALSPNRELFAVADVQSKIVIGSLKEGKILQEFKGPHGDQVEMDSLAFSADSSKLLVGVTPKVYVYNLKGEPTSVEIQTKADSTAIYTKTVNEAGLLALYYIDAKSTMPVIDFYDQSQNKSLGTFFPHQSRSTYWAVSHDGKFIATTGRGGPVRIWNVEESMRDLLPL